jgi:caa(3)-type oxidase subunit IV
MTKSQRPARILVASWLGLLALLTLTTFGAYLPLGAANTVLAIVIATIKGVLIAAVFMELRESRSLTLAFAAAGFFWLGIMLWLAMADYVTRPNFPPPLAGQRLGIKEVDDGIWRVSFMHSDLGYIDLEQRTLQTIDNPFGTRLSPMS